MGPVLGPRNRPRVRFFVASPSSFSSAGLRPQGLSRERRARARGAPTEQPAASPTPHPLRHSAARACGRASDGLRRLCGAVQVAAVHSPTVGRRRREARICIQVLHPPPEAALMPEAAGPLQRPASGDRRHRPGGRRRPAAMDRIFGLGQYMQRRWCLWPQPAGRLKAAAPKLLHSGLPVRGRRQGSDNARGRLSLFPPLRFSRCGPRLISQAPLRCPEVGLCGGQRCALLRQAVQCGRRGRHGWVQLDGLARPRVVAGPTTSCKSLRRTHTGGR